MAITIDWPTKAVTVPQSDCTWVSGTFYTFDTDDFYTQVRALESSMEGMPFQRVIDHNPEYTVAGVTYARKIEVVNSYTVEFEEASELWSVQLNGSNNNIWDIGAGVLVQNNVQVIPTNAAGLINMPTMEGVRKITMNKVTRSGDIITIYDDDGITVWKQFDLASGGRVEQ